MKSVNKALKAVVPMLDALLKDYSGQVEKAMMKSDEDTFTVNMKVKLTPVVGTTKIKVQAEIGFTESKIKDEIIALVDEMQEELFDAGDKKKTEKKGKKK